MRFFDTQRVRGAAMTATDSEAGSNLLGQFVIFTRLIYIGDFSRILAARVCARAWLAHSFPRKRKRLFLRARAHTGARGDA